MEYALHFAGTEPSEPGGDDGLDPSWLVDNDGRVIVFDTEVVAEKVRKVLYSGDEDIVVMHYTDTHETAPSKFEARYLKAWRYA
jgi:hypothetical protein